MSGAFRPSQGAHVFKIITALVPALALALLGAAAVAADIPVTPACQRNLDAASAAVTDTIKRFKAFTRAAGQEKCAAYREHFLIVVRARAVSQAATPAPPTIRMSGGSTARSRISTARSPKAAGCSEAACLIGAARHGRLLRLGEADRRGHAETNDAPV
jgi:hypothetical protein